MAHKDTGWRPDGAMDAYGGYEVWEYNIGPHQINDGVVDGDIDFDEYAEGEKDPFATSVDDLDDDDEE